MLIPTLAIAALFLQQPRHETPAARAARQAAFDTSREVISHVGLPVAEVKSALDVYRRAVFNGTDDEVLHNADYLRSSCHATDSVARVMVPKVCRGCASRDVQRAFDDYRAMLPSLSRGTAQCSARLWQLERGADAAKRLRHEVRNVGNPLVATLQVYESRLGVLLRALNIVAAPAGQASPPLRPRPARP